MPIVNSSYTVDQVAQADGRRWVKETHTDHTGKQFFAHYLASEGLDHEAVMLARVPSINANLINEEEAAGVSRVFSGADPLSFTPTHTTVQSFYARLFREVMEHRDVRIIVALKPLIDYLEATYTAQQIANYLNVSLATLGRIKTRINALAAIKTVLDEDLNKVEEI